MCEKIQEFKLSKPMFAMEKEMEEFKDFIDRILDFKDSWELMMDPFLSEVITVKPASHPSSTSSTLDQDLASLMDSLSLITTTAAAVRR